MKTRAFKRVVFPIIAVASAILLFACPAPYEPENRLPDGMGAVKLNFTQALRAVLPDSLNITDFLAFDVIFTLKDDATVEKTDNLNNTNYNDASFELYAGEYNLYIIAYKDALKTESAAYFDYFEENSDYLEITIGATQSVDVTLRHFEPDHESKTGFFAWDITRALGLGKQMSTCSMDITPLLSSGTTVSDYVFTGSLKSGTVQAPDRELTEGYYFVDLKITVNTIQGTNAGATADFLSRHIVHIYRNMTSTLEYLFTCCGITEDEKEPDDDLLGTDDGKTDDKGDIPNDYPTRTVIFNDEALAKINNASDDAYLELFFTEEIWGPNGSYGPVMYQYNSDTALQYGSSGQNEWNHEMGNLVSSLRIPLSEIREFYLNYVNLPGTDYAAYEGTDYIASLWFFTWNPDGTIFSAVYLREP